jgi:hypothetical protein
MIRALTVVAAAACLMTPAFAQDSQGGTGEARGRMLLPYYPAYERSLGEKFWFRTYRFTPGEYKRLRSAGFSRQEAYLIANAARATGLGTKPFEDAVNRGLYGVGISKQFGIKPFSLTYVMKEWQTPEWAAAIGEDVFGRTKLNVWY